MLANRCLIDSTPLSSNSTDRLMNFSQLGPRMLDEKVDNGIESDFPTHPSANVLAFVTEACAFRRPRNNYPAEVSEQKS